MKTNWGIFDRTTDSVHVAPVNDDMTIICPHILDEFCFCDPIIESVEGHKRLVVIHNEEN